MARNVHPRLLEQPVPEEEESQPQEEEVQEPEQAVVEEPNEEEFYVKLDKRNPYQSLAALDEDPEWRNHIRSLGGRKVKQEYESKVQLLEAENTSYKQRLEYLSFRNELADMLQKQGPASVQDRLAKDPEFARRYHTKYEAPDLEVVKEQIGVQAAINNVIDSALEIGLPQDLAAQFDADIKSGKYDGVRDAQGNLTEVYSPSYSISLFQKDVLQAAYEAKAKSAQPEPKAEVAPPPPPEPREAPRVSEALRQKGPDTSVAALGGSGSSTALSWEQYKAYTPRDQIKMFPEGPEEAIRTGRLKPPQ